jgi:TetR/AcrR family transcriptional regulator, copper-responsive repressor
MKTDSQPARRPRGRPREFDRDKALERAMDVFWSKGFEAASLSDLTKAMGINPPSLYAAFGDKEGLFIEAVKRYHQMQANCGGCPEQGSARGSIEELLTELATLFTDRNHPPGCLMVMAMTTSTTSSPRLHKLLAEQRAEARERMRDRIRAGVTQGELPAETDVAALADFYMAVIAGMSLHAREGGSRKALLAMVHAAMRAWPETAKRATKRVVAA